MLKVLTFTSLFPNGLQPNNAIFIKHRMEAVNRIVDVNVQIVAPVPYFPDTKRVGRWGDFARVPLFETIAGLPVYHPRYIVTPKIGMTLYGFSMFLGAYKVVNQLSHCWSFDIIDAHYVYPDGIAAILLGKIFKKPVIISARGTDINFYPRLKLIRPLVKYAVNKSDALISVSKSLAEVMIGLGADRKKVFVIPNGIDNRAFFLMDKNSARQSLKIEKKVKILLSVGSLIERKGFHILIDAINILKKNNLLDFITFIIGSGEKERELNNKIIRHGLCNHVKLIGSKPNCEFLMWYNAADLFFLGSSREGWPNVVNEALACGTPVIATKVDGIPDMINSDELGILVKRGPDNFASAINEGFNKTWDRKFISNKGQNRLWGDVASEVVSVFKLLDRNKI